MEVKGDLHVRRTGIFDKRADQGLLSASATGGYTVVRHSQHWLRLDGALVDEVVTLPVANGASGLPNGWKVVIENNGATNKLSVVDSAAGPLKDLTYAPLGSTEGAAYEFVLLDNSTPAGVWYIVELGDPGSGGLLAQKFVANFIVADWPVAVSGYQSITKAEVAGLGADQGAAGHGKGTNPVYIVQEKTGTDHDRTICDRERMAATGDLALRIVDGVAFDGRVIFV